MATVTLAVLVYDETGSALATAALFFSAKFLPSLLVPALAVRAERLAGGALAWPRSTSTRPWRSSSLSIVARGSHGCR